MKDIKERAEIESERFMTAEQKQSVNDFVDEKTQIWKADLNKSLDLKIKAFEEMIKNGYSP